MFRQMLYTQWKWSGWAVLVGSVAAFAAPILSVQRAGLIDPTFWDVERMLDYQRSMSAAYPLIAFGVGGFIALLGWFRDHEGKHVYALTLPIPRWYYALLRLGAGAVLLVPVALAFGVGALVATVAATIPPGLQAAPTAITLRFALALLVVYSAVFALAAGTRATLRTIYVTVVLVIGLQVGFNFIGLEIDFLGPVLSSIFVWPGPFDVLFGNWMLINV